MKTKNKTVSENKIIKFNHLLERDLYLCEVGFNDFNFLSPLKIFRKQSFFTLHYIISGNGIINILNQTVSAGPGNFFILPPNTDICYYPLPSLPWSYFWIAFNGKIAQKMYDDILGKNQSILIDNIPDYFSDYLLDTPLEALNLTQNQGYYKFVALLYNFWDYFDTPSKPQTNDFVDEVEKLLKLNFCNSEFNIDSLCNMIHVSHSYLCRLFAKHKNQTVKNYLNGLRMSKAAELLIKTNKSIKSIAFDCGYSNEYNFMKYFKKTYGCTPSTYRDKNC